MLRRPTLSLVTALVLFAIAAAMAGCGSKSDKGTNPMPTTEPFESGNLGSGAVFVHRFNTAGSFGYRCRIHSNMTGTVNVTATGSDSVPVAMPGLNFTPASVTVKTGGYVKWTN